MKVKINMIKEQAATMKRASRPYGFFARLLFWGLDVVHGKNLTLPKVRLLELLARIPYQAWEVRYYRVIDCRHHDSRAVTQAQDIIDWGREAQDNEFWHLEVINEKIKQDGVRLKWFRDRIIPPILAFKYIIFSWLLARISIKTAFLLNADFEDHAEHEYFNFVKNHAEMEKQRVKSPVVLKYGNFKSWADVFRRIALDERDHMNDSLIRCGRPSEVVKYR
jgi:ubiquinol oxidase